jgi:uncharacterized protein (DUF1684 family)
MQFFEATAQQKQLADIGRQMMDFSENASMSGLKDAEIAVFNELSHVGNMLTHYGAPFGTTIKNFSDADMKLIAAFMSGQLDAQTKKIKLIVK